MLNSCDSMSVYGLICGGADFRNTCPKYSSCEGSTMSKPSALRGSASRIFSIKISGKFMISENSSKSNVPFVSLSPDRNSFAI